MVWRWGMIFAQKCDKEAGRKSIKKWYAKVGEFDNKAFNDIAAAMYDREDEILNYFVNRSTNNSSSSDWSRFSVNPRAYTGDPQLC